MARVLIVSPFGILPAHGGNRARILALARALGTLGHEVHFAVARPGALDNSELHLAAFGPGRVHPLPYARLLAPRQAAIRVAGKVYRAAARAAGSHRQHRRLMDERSLAGFAPALRALHARHEFDAVIVEFVYLSRLLTFFPETVRKLIDTHDVYADRHLHMASDGPYRAYSLSAAGELRGLRRADALLAIQERDARYFRERLAGTHVAQVSHFVEDREPVAGPATPSGVFMGANSHGNADTLDILLKQILPRILARRPDFMLHVGGAICARLPEHPNIVAHGAAEDVREILAYGAIFLNPTRIGTGIAIKLLDALAHGMPIVTTAIGARGHEGSDGMAIVPDGDPDAFAEAVLSLVDDPASRAALAQRATAAARSWNQAQFAELAAAIPV